MNIRRTLISALFGLVFIGMTAFGAEAATQQAKLSWSATSMVNADRTAIERKTGPTGTYAQIGTTTGATVLTFTDATVVQGTVYCYRYMVGNAIGNSVPSDEGCNGTMGVPNKPGPLTITIEIVP